MKICPITRFNLASTKNLSKSNSKTPLTPLKNDVFTFTGKNLDKKIVIVPSANDSELERQIEKKLEIEPSEIDVKTFKNNETYVNLISNPRGKIAYLMPESSNDVNLNLMTTYLKASAAKQNGANRVVAILPNLPYARQEKKTEPGEAIAARLNIDLMKTAGVDEIITVDLHSPAITGFGGQDLIITEISSLKPIKNYIKSLNVPNLIVVSPDMGGIKRADSLAKALGTDKAIIYKYRQKHNEATAESIIGNVDGKNCVIYDDIIDTAGTICEASKLLKKNGAKDIYVCATHGLFNGNAMERLDNAPIKSVIVTNTVPLRDKSIDKIKQIDISDEISKTIEEIS